MFKDVSSIAERAVGAASQEQRQDAVRVSNRVFKTLQGMYGSLFLSKFSTGKVLPNGGDAGVISARDVWAVSLQRFDAGTVGTALDRVLTDFPEFPPSLPQFVALCRACAPRHAVQHQPVGIGMSGELRSLYSRRSRDAAMASLKAKTDMKTGFVEVPNGLAGLKQAIANAIACAGGDEAKALCRLDREIVTKEMADA